MSDEKKEIPASGQPSGDPIEQLLKINDEASLPGFSDGLQAAYAYTPEAWRDTALAAAEALAATGRPFTVDDLAAHGIGEPDRPQRYGAVFAAIRNRGIARVIGWTAHRTAGGSENGIRVWLGTTDHAGGDTE